MHVLCSVPHHVTNHSPQSCVCFCSSHHVNRLVTEIHVCVALPCMSVARANFGPVVLSSATALLCCASMQCFAALCHAMLHMLPYVMVWVLLYTAPCAMLRRANCLVLCPMMLCCTCCQPRCAAHAAQCQAVYLWLIAGEVWVHLKQSPML